MYLKGLLPGICLKRIHGAHVAKNLKAHQRSISYIANIQKMPCGKCSFLATYYANNHRQKSVSKNLPNITWNGGSSQFSVLSGANVIAFSTPVLTMQNMLLDLHSFTSLPWWSTIVLTTIGIRVLVTFPFMVYQHFILAKYLNLHPEIKQLADQLKVETAAAIKLYKWDQKRAKLAFKKSLKKHVQTLIERDNCHPFKASAVMWIQLPLWFSMSFALRNMVSMMPYQDVAAQLTYLSLSVGGFLWVPNLTVPDVSLILPISCGLFNLMIIEMNALKTTKTTKFHKIITNLLRGVSIVMIPIAATVPSCLCVYWTTSSFLGLLQNILLMFPRFRKLCGIPRFHEETQTPFLDLKENLKKKLTWKQRL